MCVCVCVCVWVWVGGGRCACGLSKREEGLCDGSHRTLEGNATGELIKPVVFTAEGWTAMTWESGGVTSTHSGALVEKALRMWASLVQATWAR